MNPSPFSRPQPERLTLMQRVLGRRPAKNALVEIVGLFDAAASPRGVQDSDIQRIAATYRIDIAATFRQDFERMYREYLVHCLVDRRLSADEVADLEHLRRVFNLEPASCEAIQRNVARQVYLKSVSEVLADGTIDESERIFLAQLREHLAIPESVADNIVDVKVRQYESRYRQTH